MKTTVRLLPGLLLMISAGAFAASELMVYANQGQDAAQQEQDEYQCYGWGKGQSGFDPMAQPTATAPPPEQQAKRGGLLRGAARGAVIGGIVDGSSGAKTGAGAGAALGGMRRIDQNRQQAQSQQQYEQQQAAQYEAGRSAYNRAYAACMEGRGYTVR